MLIMSTRDTAAFVPTTEPRTEHGRPCLIDNVQAHRTTPAFIREKGLSGVLHRHSQLVDIGMENLVHEPDAG